MYYRLQKNVEYNNFKNIKFISESRVNTTGMVQNIIEHESATYNTTYHVKSSICINSKKLFRIALVLIVRFV